MPVPTAVPPSASRYTPLQRVVDPFEIVGQHAGIAGPFLAERERRRVLHVGAADLDDVVPFVRLGGDRVVQRLHRGDQPLLHADGAAMYIADGNVSFDDCDMLT